jgi:outer membrane lipoprotein-sorting protein
MSMGLALAAIGPISLFAKEGDAGRIIDSALERFESISDYTCLFTREELVEGKTYRQTNIIYKFKKPLSVYMKWTEGPEKGIEVIYPNPKRSDKLIAHPGHFNILNLSLDPRGHLAMRNSRHSILESPIGYVLGLIKNNYATSKKNGEGVITHEGEELIEGRKTLIFKAEFPQKDGYYGHRIRINFDEQLLLPLRIVVYDWDGRLLEKYEYSQLKLNTGLTTTDFDVKNPAYSF